MHKYTKIAVLVGMLAAFCIVKGPPKAWEETLVQHERVHAKKRSKPHWYIRPPKSLQKYSATCARIAHDVDDPEKVKSSFKKLQRASRKIQKSSSYATLDQHKDKNRNAKIVPYDDTRSCQDVENFYVNANDVFTSVQSYLVAQGPLDHTVTDFWKAILHKDSNLIVTLVMAEEEGRNKCAEYWSIPQIMVDDWTVTLKDSCHIATSLLIPSHRLVVRTFLANNGKEERTIRQLHYENWPDGKIPEFDLFTRLLDETDRFAAGSSSPITVHCSAGIGRSGTFVAAHSLRKEIRFANKPSEQINVPKTIFQLRCQRTALVGTYRQYQVVLQTIAKEYQPRRTPFFVL